MAQVADYSIANANGATVRADINTVFLAVSSTNSGTSEPSTMYAFMLWVDTTTNLIKLRNAANGAWITLGLSVTASNTVDINGGAIDGTAIGASSATTGAFTTLTTTDNLSIGGSNKELRFYEGSNYVGFEAPALTGDQIWILPIEDGDADQVLATNGSGTLSFATVSGTTINNNADNRVITGSGTANTLNGEANLTYDATTLQFEGADNNNLIKSKNTGTNTPYVYIQANTAGTYLGSDSSGGAIPLHIMQEDAAPITFNTNSTERMRILSTGDVLIGQTSQTGYTFAEKLVVGDGDANDGITIQSGSTHQGNLAFNHSDGTTAYGRISYQHSSNYMAFFAAGSEKVRIDSSGNLQVNLGLGVKYQNAGGSAFAEIRCGGVGGNSDLLFKTATTEKARIDSNGIFYVGTTNPAPANADVEGVTLMGSNGTSFFSTDGQIPVAINRKGDDGVLVNLIQAGGGEGSISVSGGTVSYNAFMGSHYTEMSEDNPYIGTVMETIGTLVENKYASQKRLPKCKISDTADSSAVYGVWFSDGTDSGELVASIGASWCRIHKDETINIGDLLVSKGDGTAKVQDDDIIRSKTIGKITSTVKKTTYDDDSYIVPVVLYCG